MSDLYNLKREIPDNEWKYLTRKLAYPYECFKSFDDQKKPVNNLKKEDFFSNLKNDYPEDKEIKRTKIVLSYSISKKTN